MAIHLSATGLLATVLTGSVLSRSTPIHGLSWHS